MMLAAAIRGRWSGNVGLEGLGSGCHAPVDVECDIDGIASGCPLGNTSCLAHLLTVHYNPGMQTNINIKTRNEIESIWRPIFGTVGVVQRPPQKWLTRRCSTLPEGESESGRGIYERGNVQELSIKINHYIYKFIHIFIYVV